MAQAAANIGSSLFGGFCVTGTIAHTATNVRAGAHGPIAGMLHAVFLMLFMLVADPLAAFIPLAALDGVLAVVAWNMIEKPAIGVLLRLGLGEAVVLAATFFPTIFRDQTEAIVVGFALGSVLFIYRMSKATEVVAKTALVGSDCAGIAHPREAYEKAAAANPEVVVYRIAGALFFGAAASIGSVLDRIQDCHKALVIDFSAVPLLDSTGANMIEGLAHKAQKRGVDLWLTRAGRDIQREFEKHGLKPPLVRHAENVQDALAGIAD